MLKYQNICNFFLSSILIFSISCFSRKEYKVPNYEFEVNFGIDSTKMYLVKNNFDTIDEVSIKECRNIVESRFYELKINRNVEGWSCEFRDELLALSELSDSLLGYNDSENRFLKLIARDGNLQRGDENLLLNYWKEINDSNFVVDTDSLWKYSQDSFFKYVVNNSGLSSRNLDLCEREMYLDIYMAIKNKNDNEYFMSYDWMVNGDSEFDSDAYFAWPYKKLIVNYDDSGVILPNIDHSLFVYYR